MEGLAMEYTEASNILDEQNIAKGEFHSFLSDDGDQGTATTAAHKKIVNLLLESNRIERNTSAAMEKTYGCSKQYRSASSLYLISTISMKYVIVIDCAVGAPGYGKDLVDGLNAVDRRCLRTAMFRNYILE
eukprot:415909-Ditylum_brightwellii.AAC.1